MSRKSTDQRSQIAAHRHYNTGIALAAQGRLEDAAAAYCRALVLDSNFIEAHNNLGNIRKAQGKTTEARACFERSITLAPHLAEPFVNLGNVLREAGELSESVECYRRALSIRPDLTEALVNLGIALAEMGRLAEAIECHRKALTLRPSLAEAHVGLGTAFRQMERPAEALEHYRKALNIRPNLTGAHIGLGNVLLEQNDPQEAIKSYRQAIAINPNSLGAHMSLAYASRCSGDLSNALESSGHAVIVKPDNADAHFTKATILLLTGDYEAGWKEYEWRWRTSHLKPLKITAPMWTGEDLQGKIILLHSEQGLGDSIQFVRYAPLVKERGGRVLLSCPKSLARLFKTIAGIDDIYSSDDVPDCTFYAPLLSLPSIFRTTLESIPNQVPYLFAAREQTNLWAKRLRSFCGLKVGLVWAGNPSYGRRDLHFAVDRRRNMRLEQFEPLAAVPNVQFFSLQKGPGAEEVRNQPNSLRLIDLMDQAGDFSDTAALIANLDLVISVDTSVAHLAGAMGVPVWVLSRYDGCWRWLWNRDDSPWYQTLRLFRQPAMGDWQSVIESVRLRLLEWAETNPTRSGASEL